MPVQPSYPGVYVEEVSSGVRTIVGASTSIAAFLGRTTKGPINQAVRIVGLANLERTFGGSPPDSDLGHSVRLFFQNGGTDCYVVRLVKEGTDATASVKVKDETQAWPVLAFTAKTPGVEGNWLALQVKYNSSDPEGAFDVNVLKIAAGVVQSTEKHPNLSMDKSHSRYAPLFVTQNSQMVDCSIAVDDLTYNAAEPGYSLSRRPLAAADAAAFCADLNPVLSAGARFRLSVDGNPAMEIDLGALQVAVQKDASNAPDLGLTLAKAATDLTGTINSLLPTPQVVAATLQPGPTATVLLKIASATALARSIAIQPTSDRDLAGALMLGTDRGGIEVPRYAKFRPAPTGSVLQFSKIDLLANLKHNDWSSLSIGATSQVTFNVVTKTATSKWFIDKDGKYDGVREKLAIIAKAVNDEADSEPAFPCTAEVWGYRLALIPRSGINNSLLSFTIGAGSTEHNDWFNPNVRNYSLGDFGTGTFQTGGVKGDDGQAPGPADYLGSASSHKGLYALDLADAFNLLVIPWDSGAMTDGQYRSLWGPASGYCQARRAFLVMDAPKTWSPKPASGIGSLVNGEMTKLRSGMVKENAAVFFPRLLVSDRQDPVGASGAIAGVLARTDATRGVWKAPAGVEAGLVGIAGIDLVLTDQENGVLNQQGVNCLRLFPEGIVNWGARTLAGADNSSSEWKYIPVRRTALFIEESLYRGTKWVVFEPNDEPLWAQIRLNIGAFMHSLFRQGAFQGKTPKEAYLVKCDGETTTQDDINKGIVNILVGFAPLKPAEFVMIRLQQMAGQIEA